MRLLGNICWFIFGGCLSGLAWLVSGIVWCITIVGIPYGLQCFKFASLSFFPFGKQVEYGGGAVSFLVNIIWLIFNGWWMALGNFLIGCLWCITIVGIPFGKQFFKIARISYKTRILYKNRSELYQTQYSDPGIRIHCQISGRNRQKC